MVEARPIVCTGLWWRYIGAACEDEGDLILMWWLVMLVQLRRERDINLLSSCYQLKSFGMTEDIRSAFREPCGSSALKIRRETYCTVCSKG